MGYKNLCLINVINTNAFCLAPVYFLKKYQGKKFFIWQMEVKFAESILLS